MASYASSDTAASPPRSSGRAPSFSHAVSAACSRNTAAAPSHANASGQPIRRPTCASAHQSARASPGASRNARCRLIRRSEFVTVPLRSPHPAAGSSTCAYRVVSVGQMSLTTTNGHRANAARTRPASGMLSAGLVQITHSARTRPSPTASNKSTAFSPGPAAIFGASQNRRTRSTAPGCSNPICAANWFASPPTSRPPIAFGCPVTLNGPAPGRPIRPVAKCTFRIALTLSVPDDDWFTPCE